MKCSSKLSISWEIEATEVINELVDKVRQSKSQPSVAGILKRVGLSRSNYYAQKKRPVSVTKLKRQEIKRKIKEIWEESKHIYGAPKNTMILRKNGFHVAIKNVSNYMREIGIKTHYAKPWTTTTRDSEYSDQLINYLDEHFNPETPNTCWCIDTTYISTRNGFAYLTSVMDLYSRRIIAWDLSDNLEVANVVSLIERAKRLRGITMPLIMHSDRGSQFTSAAYKAVTADFQLSYSKKAYPWDNACIESFHALIKRKWLNQYDIRSHKEAHRLVFEYIETFYNTVRIHSHCDYTSPKDFEDNYYDNQAVIQAA